LEKIQNTSKNKMQKIATIQKWKLLILIVGFVLFFGITTKVNANAIQVSTSISTAGILQINYTFPHIGGNAMQGYYMVGTPSLVLNAGSDDGSYTTVNVSGMLSGDGEYRIYFIDGSLPYSTFTNVELNGSHYIKIFYTTGVGWTMDTGGKNGFIDNSTHIETVTPYNGQILATSSSYTIGATGAIASTDFNENSKLKIHIENSAKSYQQCADVICAGLSNNAISLNFEYPLVIASTFSYSTTTSNLPIGKYWVTTEINTGTFCFLGICLFDKNVISTSTSFTIATATKADILKQSTIDYANTLTTSTSTNFDNCGIASFNLFDCGSDLITWSFVPTPDAINYFVTTAHNNILTHFPLGYVYDFINIISTSTVGTLTVIDATMPDALGYGSGAHIHLDLTGVLDPYLNATTSQFTMAGASTTETLFEYTNYYWKIIVYILVFLYILFRILGGGIIPHKNKIEIQ
jgi:hypothetical protein